MTLGLFIKVNGYIISNGWRKTSTFKEKEN